jgi:hypothetical protein
MKKPLLFVILTLVVAVWVSAMACVATGALTSPSLLSLVGPYVCPPGTEMQVEQMRQSYHEPGETSVFVRCVGDGVEQEVTLKAGLALWVLFLAPSVPVAGLLTLAGWLFVRWRQRAVLAQAGPQMGGQAVGAVIVDGQSYTSVDAMPPHVREAYGKAMSVLGDADGDGVPDVLQGLVQGQTGGEMQRLIELKRMLDAELITAAEYETKKNEILSDL